MEHVHYEDENTRYICIGPINKVLNMLCCWVEDQNSEAFKLHLPRINDYLRIAEDGMKMQGYSGSQLWDTAFAAQAILATGFSKEFGTTLKKAHKYVKDSQVLEDCPGDLSYWHRHISKGAWPFSTADHGWPISDCTAEGLKVALLLSKFFLEIVGDPIVANRLYDVVNVILSLMLKRGTSSGASVPSSAFYGSSLKKSKLNTTHGRISTGSFKVMAADLDETKQTKADRWAGLGIDISDDQQDITRGKGLVDSLFQAPTGDGIHVAVLSSYEFISQGLRE